MEFLKSLIKDYGPAIGPILAFVFGILTLMIKYGLDKLLDRRKIFKSFKILKDFIIDNPPPEYLPVGEVESILGSKACINNLDNILKYRNRLISIDEIIKVVDNDLINTLDLISIRQYHNIKCYFRKILDIIDIAIEEKELIGSGVFVAIHSFHKDIVKIIDSKDEFFKYTE